MSEPSLLSEIMQELQEAAKEIDALFYEKIEKESASMASEAVRDLSLLVYPGPDSKVVLFSNYFGDEDDSVLSLEELLEDVLTQDSVMDSSRSDRDAMAKMLRRVADKISP